MSCVWLSVVPPETCRIWFASGPVQLGSIGQNRAGWFLHTGLLPDRIRLAKTRTQSARTKSDPGRFCIMLSTMFAEERNLVWKWETGSGPVASCQKPGPVIPAHRLASGPDVLSQTRPSTSDPGQFCIAWSVSSLKKRSWYGCGKSDLAYTIRPNSGCTLAVMAITKTLLNRIRHVYWVELLVIGVCCQLDGWTAWQTGFVWEVFAWPIFHYYYDDH